MSNLKLHRVLCALVAVLAAIMLGGGVALAAHPNFTSASASGLDDAGKIFITFQEVGLGNAGEIHYEATSPRVTSTYACLDAFGAVVSEGTETVGVTNYFAISHPGQNTRTAELDTWSDSVICPPDQTIVLAARTYEQLSVTDTTNHMVISIPGTFSRTYIG